MSQAAEGGVKGAYCTFSRERKTCSRERKTDLRSQVLEPGRFTWCGNISIRAAVPGKMRPHRGSVRMTIIRYSALIIKDKSARTVARNDVRGALVESRSYRDHLVQQKCHSTSTRTWN